MVKIKSFKERVGLMAKISEEVKKLIQEIRPALVATAGKNGRPNVSPKGSFRIFDDEHVLFVDLRSPQTIANLKENPQLSAIGLNPDTRQGWRIWGKAEEFLTSGELFEKITQEYAGKGKGTVNHVVKIAVDEAILL